MPHQNRVTPFGEIERSRARGLLMGNRGILHNEGGSLRPVRWRHKNWVACVLAFKNRRRTINAPGRYTELFFLDEAVSLAAGHRPCAECRRRDFEQFVRAWQRAQGLASAPRASEIDRAFHAARVTRDRRQVRTSTRVGTLPDGTFISMPDDPGTAWLIWDGALHRWTHEGYTERRLLHKHADVILLTPEPIVRALTAGYRPFVHPTVGREHETEKAHM